MFTKSSEYGRRAAATTPPSLWDPVGASVAYWAWLSRVSEIWWTRSTGRAAIDAAGRNRFDALVRFARERSPFYRDAYRGLPARRARTGRAARS